MQHPLVRTSRFGEVVPTFPLVHTTVFCISTGVSPDRDGRDFHRVFSLLQSFLANSNFPHACLQQRKNGECLRSEWLQTCCAQLCNAGLSLPKQIALRLTGSIGILMEHFVVQNRFEADKNVLTAAISVAFA